MAFNLPEHCSSIHCYILAKILYLLGVCAHTCRKQHYLHTFGVFSVVPKTAVIPKIRTSLGPYLRDNGRFGDDVKHAESV